MSLYLDTSLVVAALTSEPETERAQAWLELQQQRDLSTSLWIKAEFSSAVARKQRMRELDADGRAEALAAFTRLAETSFAVLPISDLDFHAAARFVDLSMLGLRASDALHLALCFRHGETLCTLDRLLVEAGTALGVKTMLV